MKTLILAGTHAQAVEWRLRNQVAREDAVYVPSASWLRGRRTGDTPRVVVGTFHQRADATEILDYLVVTDLR